MIWTVNNRWLAFSVYAGPCWADRAGHELRVMLGRDEDTRFPKGSVIIRAELYIALGRRVESVIDWGGNPYLPKLTWFRDYGAGGWSAHRSQRWTGRSAMVWTGIDWPLRVSFWRTRWGGPVA